ncbi:MAG: rod shape-determining protein MreD [Rubrivivax sp.]|jgi:rod shape-determining protein MreD
MIMPRGGDQLLLPANPLFIAVTLLVALATQMLPLGRTPWMPDLLALVLVFWNVHQTRRVGMGIAFAAGLVIDVHQGALLGQHALAYTLLSFGATALHKRILHFGTVEQALHVLPLLFGVHLLVMGMRLAGGGMAPGWSMLLAPLLEAALWPVAAWLLLAPQRRAPDPDENRPL